MILHGYVRVYQGGKPLFSYRCCYDFPMFLWFSHGFSIFPWLFLWISYVFLWFHPSFPTVPGPVESVRLGPPPSARCHSAPALTAATAPPARRHRDTWPGPRRMECFSVKVSACISWYGIWIDTYMFVRMYMYIYIYIYICRYMYIYI